MKTPWKRISVCRNCLSKRLAGNFVDLMYCKKCGHSDAQPVLIRYIINLNGIHKESKQYRNYTNPYEKEDASDG